MMNQKSPKSIMGFRISMTNMIMFLLLINTIISGAISMIAWQFPRIPLSDIKIQKIDILTRKDNYCPGELIKFQVDAFINQTPAVIGVVQNVWNTEVNLPIIVDESVTYLIAIRKNSITPIVPFIVPKLPPGNYELRIAAFSQTTIPEALSIPFAISENCSTNIH